MVEELISRKDGLNHLLLSDVNLLMASIQADFPDLAKMYSIGKSYEGRDINILELSMGQTAPNDDEVNVVQTKVSKEVAVPASDEELVQTKSSDETNSKPAVLMTGATHARELISTSTNVYEMLKLLKKGAVSKEDKYANLLAQNKYYFMPILNVDGVAYIEEQWEKTHKIPPDRKNMNPSYDNCAGVKDASGVDLNRNFEVDFGQVDDIVRY